MQSEIWKSVKEVADKLKLNLEDDPKDYQVSNLGGFRIVSEDGTKEEGHITISESQASVTIGKRQVLFHRLLALLFLYNDNPEVNTVVVYRDGDHTNNNVENLAWVSVSERNERRYINQKSTRNIRCVDDDIVFASATSAALYYGIPVDLIKDSIAKSSTCFSHTFEYATDCSNETAIYLSTRKAKSLSSMLEDIDDLKPYFDEVYLK